MKMCKMSVTLEINRSNRPKAFEAALAIASALIKMCTRNVSALSRLTCLYTVQIGKNSAVSQTRLCANCFLKCLRKQTYLHRLCQNHLKDSLIMNIFWWRPD